MTRKISPDHASKWYSVLRPLSLEKVEPFIRAMGLQLSQREFREFQAHARQFISKYMESEGNGNTLVTLFNEMFDGLYRAVGDRATSEVLRWGDEHIFRKDGMDGIEFAWAVLLQKLGNLGWGKYDSSETDLHPDQVNRIKSTIVDEFQVVDKLTDQLSESEAAEPTEWESIIRDDYEEQTSPFDWLTEFLNRSAAKKILKQIEQQLDDVEFQKLLVWAQMQAKEIGIPEHLVSSPPNNAP